jgi:hypothetical protein
VEDVLFFNQSRGGRDGYPKKVKGVVELNDGDFAEVQTVGIEGIEKNLLLWKIQLHRENTNDSRPEFQRRFPVDTWVDIWLTIEVRSQLGSRNQDFGNDPMRHI